MLAQAGPQAGKPPSVSGLFDRFDKNKDGKLTKAQAAERKKDLAKHITDRVKNVRPERPKGDAGRPFDGHPPQGAPSSDS